MRWIWLPLALGLGVGAVMAQDVPPRPSGDITELERLRETVEVLRGRLRQDEDQLALLRAYIRQLEKVEADLRSQLPPPKKP